MKKEYEITIGWLYPDLMSTYGDRGNIAVLTKRGDWHGIKTTILPVNQETKLSELKNIDLIFGGGSQDIQQEIVMRDLQGEKGETLKELIENEVPALFVCGSPQLMGTYYEPAMGKRIKGLGVFDMYSVNPGPDTPRCIGNIIAQVDLDGFQAKIVGFENHGGRTYLGQNVKPFAKVIHGYGNNGKDGTEGVIYKNAIGCYFHGPLLPKNPSIADYLIKKTIEVKYKTKIELSSINEMLESRAREVIMNRYNK